MSIKKIIAIGSAKGGVGKSTITAALASSLSKKYKVGVLDADIYGPNQHILFDIKSKPEFITLNNKKLIKPFIKQNIEMISIGLILDSNKAAAWRGPMLSGAIKQLSNSTHWSDLDYLLIDMPPGTGDAYLTIFKDMNIDTFIIITTINNLAFADVKKTINLVEKFNIPILGYIENNILGSDIIDDNIFQKKKIEKLGSVKFNKKMEQFNIGNIIEEVDEIAKLLCKKC
tara:strand:- start:459 stop:1145 length:687 start_codon:yes stop_codon:yes gene_type:complete